MEKLLLQTAYQPQGPVVLMQNSSYWTYVSNLAGSFSKATKNKRLFHHGKLQVLLLNILVYLNTRVHVRVCTM